jgi:hypothetical protein
MNLILEKTMSAISIAGGVLLGTLMVGCNERNALAGPVGTTTGPLSADAAAGKTSVVLDPVGDATSKAQDYQDIVKVEITKVGRHFVFVMELAAAMPDNPPVPPGSDLLLWEIALDTDPAAFPLGYPFPKDPQTPFEFVVEHRVYRPGFTDPLDPTQSAGFLLDRRPLLTGGQATITPVQFNIEGTTITWVIDAALLGDPSTFKWVGVGDSFAASNQIEKNGYYNKSFFDLAPEVLTGAAWATWPQ